MRLRVFARIFGCDSVPKDTRIFEAVRSADLKDVELFLPECNEVVSTGWVPEIVYTMKDASDLLQIVIRPDDTFFRKRAHRDAETAVPRIRKERSEQKQEEARCSMDNVSSTLSEDKVCYRVTFLNREIMVNGFRLATPHFDSENHVVFEYIFRNPGRKIDLSEIEAVTKRTLNKKLYDIIRTLGFKNELKDIFFPNVSKTAIEFVNPVTEADFQKRKLREPHLYA